MNAVSQPIRRPTYSTTVGCTREQWLTNNHGDLMEWFLMCDGEPHDTRSFVAFAETQFELTEDKDARFKDGLYNAQLHEVDTDDEVHEDTLS